MAKWTKLQQSFLRDADINDRPLEILAYCLAKEQPIPDELKAFFVEAVKAGVRGELASWDTAFGRPNTRQQYAEFLKDFDLAPELEKRVNEAKGHLSDEEFERIGKELSPAIGATKAKGLLSWWRQLIAEQSQTSASPNPPKKAP